MLNRIFFYLKKFDWILFFSVVLLICFGLAEIYSVALSKGGESLENFNKQLFFFAIGVLALFLFSFFDYNNLRSYSKYLYIAGIILLIGVLIIGKTVSGTKGWYDFGKISLQPVEFIKFILLIFLAKYLAGKQIKINSIKHLLLSGSGTGIFILLVLKQPDFGSALILFLVWITMIIVSGFNIKYISIIGIILILSLTCGWFFFFADYQKERIITFINPEKDLSRQGYNINQATIAIGSGGIIGRGIGFGSQSQLKFLPESQNDFIFAVISEELGFLGICLVIILFGIIFYRMFLAIKKSNDDFGIYFILGAIILIFIEMFINIGMNIGLLPIIGISLPFLSYGGSSLISSLIIIGAVESIIIHSSTHSNYKMIR